MGVNTKREQITIKNSWGTSWGDSGHAKLPFADLDKLLRADGEALITTESKPEAKWLTTTN